MNFTTFPQLCTMWNVFFTKYNLLVAVEAPSSPKGKLIPKKERQCRFCGKDHTQTTFKSKSHMIPEMLGNKYLLSDFECDECNSVFSRYESDLSCSLGIQKTLWRLLLNQKGTGFTSPSKAVTAEQEDFFGIPATSLKQDLSKEESFKIDLKNGESMVSLKKNGYILLTYLRSY